MNDYIEYIGICENLPTDIKYFKEELFDTIITKENRDRLIKSIISVEIDCKVISTKLVNTDIRTSNEGQKLSGKKMLVEILISYRIKYLADGFQNYLYILKSKRTKVVYVVLPRKIKDIDIEYIVRRNKIHIDTLTEDIYAEVRGENQIYIRGLILINVNL